LTELESRPQMVRDDAPIRPPRHGGKGGSAKPVGGGPAPFLRFVRYHRCPEGRLVRSLRTRDVATMAGAGGLGHDGGGPIKGC
jgi:hypothetical protein